MEHSRKKSRAECDLDQVRGHRLWRVVGLFAASAFALLMTLTLMQCSIRTSDVTSWNSTWPAVSAADRPELAHASLKLDDGFEQEEDLRTCAAGNALLLPCSAASRTDAHSGLNHRSGPGTHF